jgi:hypothetical protein
LNDRRKSCFAHLSLPDGVTKPYRPKPRDFREMYIRMGWDGLPEHYGTNWRVIRRWIEEEGREFLRVARAEYVRAQRKKRRKRYVLGRTLTAVNGGKGEA